MDNEMLFNHIKRLQSLVRNAADDGPKLEGTKAQIDKFRCHLFP